MLVGCGGEGARSVEVTQPESVAAKRPVAANVEHVKTVDVLQTQKRNGLRYRIGSETPFTGTVITHYETGKKAEGIAFRGGKRHRETLGWYENGQKMGDVIYKDGELFSEMKWDNEGNEIKG